MIRRPITEFQSIEEDVVALFQHLLAEMPPNAASLEVRASGETKREYRPLSHHETPRLPLYGSMPRKAFS